MKRTPCGHLLFFVAVSVSVGLCGCAIVRSTASAKGAAADTAFVRSVDFDQAPEMKDLAERARQIGNEVYPKILTLLADDRSKLPRQFDIVFKKHISSDTPGVTLGKRIRLNTAWLANYPVYLNLVLTHEMAHVAQRYPWHKTSKIPLFWREGIADYARYKVGFTNGWGCPECSAEFPHYTSGWSCAGAFLLYLDKTYGSNVVRQLNAELRRGAYSDKFFTKATGKGLDELWAEFQKTPAFTPIAAELRKLHEALGYVNGRAPEDAQARFEAYLRQRHADSQIDKLHEALGYVNGKPPHDVLGRYATFLYYWQPAGALTENAADFLMTLDENGQLPGISKGDHREAWLTPDLSEQAGSNSYPVSRAFLLTRAGDQSLYYYMLVRPSEDNGWKLQKASRIGPDGRVVEEYSVP